MGDLECGVKILARIIGRSVEIPIKDEKVDAKAVRPSELLLHCTGRVVLPAGEGLTILVGAKWQPLEMDIGERSGPSIEVIRTKASVSLG